MNDNRIEDFFNKSLEGFNDAPSDMVWADVENRLDEATPFYKKTFFIVGFITAILLLLMSGLFYQMNTKITKLITENQSLNTEIAALKKDNYHQEISISNCQKNKNTQKNIVVTESQSAANSIIQQIDNDALKNRKNRIVRQESINEVLQKNDEQNNNPSDLLTENNSDEIIKNNEIEPIKNKQNKSEINLQSFKIGYLQGITPYYARSGKRLLNGFDYTLRSLPNRKNSIEIGFNVFKTDLLTPNGIENTWGLGQSINLKRRFSLSSRLKAIGGIGFSVNTYQSKITPDNLLSIQGFPGLNEQLGIINQVTVSSKILNGSIGFQYDLAARGNFTPFIKSSVIWKIYLPQTFEYELSDYPKRTYQDNRLFAYFGSIDMAFGVERILNYKYSYQLEIFVEKSLIPLGVEDVNLMHLGCRAAWLF